jgi:hypothetical protein
MRRIALGSVAALILTLGLSGTGTGAADPGQRRDRGAAATRESQKADVRPGRTGGEAPRSDRQTPPPREGRAGAPAPTSDAPPTAGSVTQPAAPGANGTVRPATRVLRRQTPPSPPVDTAVTATPEAGSETPSMAYPAPLPVPEMPVPEGLPLAAPETIAPLLPPPAEQPAVLAPALAGGFAGLGDSAGAIPPDTHGAVGPNHVMETLNTQVQVVDRSTMTRTTLSLGAFWWPADTVTPLSGEFDPRVLYDPEGGRWISVACDNAGTANSAIFIGVSPTSSPLPLNTWFQQRIDVDSTDSVWADYPSVGFNSRWVVVQVNMFNVSDNLFNRTHIYVFDKARLYDPVPTLSYYTYTDAAIGGTQVPAATYDSGQTDIYLLERWNSGAGLLRLWRLTGSTALPTLQSVGYISGPPWTDAAGPPPTPDFAPQSQTGPGCSYCPSPPCEIQTNDSRIQNVVFRNGKLWAAQTVLLPAGTPDRSSIQWWQLDTSGNVLQRGLVDDSSGARFFAFPSIAVNKNDDALLGYSSFQDNQWASGSYSFRLAIDAPGTMQSESFVQPGKACYYKVISGVRNRWGDYSATVVDPTDDVRLWTLQEYAADPDLGYIYADQRDRWGTWWGALDPTPQVRIDDVTMNEGDTGSKDFVFTLTLTDPLGTPLATSQPVTVPWSTQDDTATTADLDYQGVVGGLVTFSPGETTQTLAVTVYGDLKLEGDETFFVNLGSPTNATLADSQGLGTILNDDPAPQLSIGDVQVVEGNSGTTNAVFPVTLSNPSSVAVSASWSTADGTATLANSDYVQVSGGTVAFPANTTGPQYVTVLVNGDTTPEPDEVFYVDLSGASGAALLKARGVGEILDDDVVNPGVSAFTIVSDSVGSAATDGRNRLQWFVPASATGATDVLIKYNSGATCTPPPNPTSGTQTITVPLSGGDFGNTMSVTHQGGSDPPVLGQQYCYSAFLTYPGPVYSAGESMSARPFDSTGNVKWKLFTPNPATALAPPTVGFDAVIGLSNDGYVQAMQRGPTGGVWPGPWKPLSLGDVAQHRAPVVPLPGGSRAFISTQNGWIYAVDTANGNLVWSTQLPEGRAQGAPAGIFTAFGGKWDYILVGTSAGANNRFYALDPATGAVIDAFPAAGSEALATGSIGAILGAATVDYGGDGRVYFASRKDVANQSLWCLDLGPASDALRLAWKSGVPGAINGSPVLANGRVYVVDENGTAWSVAPDGSSAYSLSLGDGDGKGFLFPDRGSTDLYVATQTQVHALTDNVGTSLVTKPGWATPFTVPSPGHPSVVLLRPGTNELYVGVDQYPPSNAAGLLHINADDGTFVSFLQLEATSLVIGAPSLDIGQAIPQIHVGSEAGVFYAVQLGF